MNNENLIPLNKRTKAERKRVASMGGLASGKARRTAKCIKEAAVKILQEERQKSDGSVVSAAEAVVRSVLAEATKGNIQAARFLAEVTGDLVQKVEYNTPPTFIVADFGDE